MMEPGHSDVSDARVDALRLEGADRLDPVRFHYIQVLAHRTSAHEGTVKRLLEEKLDAAVAALRKRLEHAQQAAQTTMATPQSTECGETLGDLVRQLAQYAPQKTDGRAYAPVTGSRDELKSVRYFRNTWSKLSAEKQVTQALGQAPKNAGPINSHVVALRSLALMRDTSPDYLNRFMSYVDTLLRLDQGDNGTPPAAKSTRVVKPRR